MTTNYKLQITNYSRGFGLIEILIGAAVLSIALLGISSFFQTAFLTSRVTRAQIQSGYLLEEGVEALKLMRDNGYASTIGKLSTTTSTYLTWNATTTKWATTTTNTLIDGKYERKIISADVKRDATNDIAAVGTYDSNVKLVTVTVSWKDTRGATSTRSIPTYIFNLFNN